MLYIKFNIQEPAKFEAFQKLYSHMLRVRQTDFEQKEEEAPKYDWDNMTKQEEQILLLLGKQG